MTRTQISAGAGVMILGATALLLYLFYAYVLAGLGLFVTYRILMRKHLGARRARRGLAEITIVALAGGLLTRRSAPTHPCQQCGHPLTNPRLTYCGPDCRRYARLEREELRRKSVALQGWGELPEGF